VPTTNEEYERPAIIKKEQLPRIKMSPDRSVEVHSRVESVESFTRYQSPHKKLSIDKQLEFSGERRNMNYAHQVHLKDRDGSYIYDEQIKLKQAL
jgi:hypothetical protein